MQPTMPGVPTDQPTVPPREAEPRPAPASVCCCSGLSYPQTPVWAASQARLGSAHGIYERAPGDGPPPSCKHRSLSGPGPGFSQLTAMGPPICQACWGFCKTWSTCGHITASQCNLLPDTPLNLLHAGQGGGKVQEVSLLGDLRTGRLLFSTFW